MTKYVLLGAPVDENGIVDIPDDVKVIGPLYYMGDGTLNVAMLREVDTKSEQSASASEDNASEDKASEDKESNDEEPANGE